MNERKSNKQKIIDAVFDLLNGGEKNITRYKVALYSGVERSQVYSIIKNSTSQNKG